jgi:NADH dehydrogenase
MEGTRFILVEAQDRIMPEIPPSLAEFAARELRRRGIEIRTGTMLESVEPLACSLSTGERIPTRTVAWTAGVRPSPAVATLGLPLGADRRIEVDATMRVSGRENVWGIGDAAGVPDPAKRGKSSSPPTAQHALRQGKVVADNVAAAMSGGKLRRFRYRTLGVFVDMGRHKAVATMAGVRLRGFPAWFAARTYHLAAMPGVGRRMRLVTDWTVALFFGRAAAELGSLGHPPELGSLVEEQRQEGQRR